MRALRTARLRSPVRAGTVGSTLRVSTVRVSTVLAGTVLAGTVLLAACGTTPVAGTTAGRHSAGVSSSPAAPSAAPASSSCPSTTPEAYGTGYLSDIQFVSPTQGWVVGEHDIMATSDGGKHWAIQDSGRLNLTSVDFISATVGWAVGTRSLLTTTDGGLQWRALPDPCLRSVHFVSPHVGFATSGGRGPFILGVGPALGRLTVLTTNDGGRSWHALRVPADPQSVCFNDPDQGWLGAGGKLYRTTDGGRDWTLATAGAKPPSAGDLARMVVQCAGGGAVWALDIGPGAAMSQEPHIGYYASASAVVPLFAEQYFPHPGVSVTSNSPGSYAGPISAISSTSAAFLDSCPACGPGTVPWDLVTGTTVTREGNVGGLTQVQSASFLSPELGWVAGTLTRFGAATSRAYQRIVWTDDGGRTWRVLYTS